MALITDLPTNSNPSRSDYTITDNGTTTSKTPLSAFPTINTFNLPYGESTTITFGQYASALVLVNGYSATLKSIYLVRSAVTLLTMGEIASSSNVSATANGLTITFSNNSTGSAAAIYVIMLAGTVS